MPDNPIGASIRRKEDHRFLIGKGRYTDDLNRPGQVYACFLRSSHAHANLESVDIQQAQAAPGVLGVFTEADLAADDVGPIPCAFAPDRGQQNAPPRPALARGKVRFVGDPVAAVAAVDRHVAVALPNDSIERRKAEPRSLASFLGREERLEDVGQVIGRDADAGIADFEQDPGALGDA